MTEETNHEKAIAAIIGIALSLAEIDEDMATISAYIQNEPIPEPPPEPSRPTAWVKVTAGRCHLRAINHLDGAGKAVWNSYPKGSDNPGRDRYLAFKNVLISVYMDGKIRWGKYKGAIKGSGGNHGWEVCPGQTFNGHMVRDSKLYVSLYILCKDAKRV